MGLPRSPSQRIQCLKGISTIGEVVRSKCTKNAPAEGKFLVKDGVWGPVKAENELGASEAGQTHRRPKTAALAMEK